MKVTLIQPRYSMNTDELDKCFSELLGLLRSCDATSDLIVLPEYSDAPARVSDTDSFRAAVNKNNAALLKAASEAASRCHAFVCVNAAYETKSGLRNTTHIFDRSGNLFGRYFKAHPAPSEIRTVNGGIGLDASYSYEFREPFIADMDGVRCAFLTCFDFYFYEMFPKLARENIDLIIGCSLQRSDTHEALEIFGRFLSYQTNAYLVRSSVSLGPDSACCGCSMIVSPSGDVLLNMRNRVGTAAYDIDPKKKYLKPAGFGGAQKPHWEYAETGRRPWLYRPAGSMMLPDDDRLPYPRVCAHRGFSTVLPENTLPAFGAAVALGAEEIEFDIYATKDRRLVSMHDSTLDRVSDGHGNVWDYTLEELRALSFGLGRKELDKLRITTFEEILSKFANTTIMNIHVKIWDLEQEDDMMDEIIHLLHKYDCERHVYMMSTSCGYLKRFRRIAPEIHLCKGFLPEYKSNYTGIVDDAISCGCEKIQLFTPYYDQETIDKAKSNGITVNFFYSDDPAKAVQLLEMGADTILTNDYLNVATAIRAWKDEANKAI